MPLTLPLMDPLSGEDAPVAPLDLEGEVGAAMRPSLTSGYSKQFQKSLPPRFLRQQVLDLCCFIFSKRNFRCEIGYRKQLPNSITFHLF